MDKRQPVLLDFMHKHGFDDYDKFFNQSISKIDWFWSEITEYLELSWMTKYTDILAKNEGSAWDVRWYSGGTLNITESCLDKYSSNPKYASTIALICESDDGSSVNYSYNDLLRHVNMCANGLLNLGAQQGDRIAVFLPMIAENVIALLAIARIGAVAVPCFSGYGSSALITRLNDCSARFLITSDISYRRGKVINMQEEADKAVRSVKSIERVIMVKRNEDTSTSNKTVLWNDMLDSSDLNKPAALKSDDLLMILYTSGTTGKPKGTLHSHTSFPIKAAVDAALGMDIKQGDTLFWVTDMGWMMGPWMLFSSLILGSTMVLYEGVPNYPNPDRIWDIVCKHNVTHLGISPTLIRTLMKHGDEWLENHDISGLRLFASTGEPWNPDPWEWLFQTVGGSKIPICNYSGGTEISGGILGNVLLKPIVPCAFNSPMPGMDADILDESGKSVTGKVGELVIRQPWVGMAQGFWNDEVRYKGTYWSRWSDVWLHGDWAKITIDGNWYITGRSDDTINVAGKRLGPAEMESVLVNHHLVVEAATIGVPHPQKGESAVCFITIRSNVSSIDNLSSELIEFVSENMGKALKPDKVYVVEQLPKTRNGKILRRVIKAAYLNVELGDLSSLDNPEAVNYIKNLRA